MTLGFVFKIAEDYISQNPGTPWKWGVHACAVEYPVNDDLPKWMRNFKKSALVQYYSDPDRKSIEQANTEFFIKLEHADEHV